MRAFPFFLALFSISLLTANPAVHEVLHSYELDFDAVSEEVASEEDAVEAEPVDEEVDAEEEAPEPIVACAPEKATPSCIPNWYFEVKPGYYYFMDDSMRQFFDNGGFTIRGEAGYRLWGPLTLWFDGSYFKKEGHALGGFESTKLVLATLSLGLKLVCYPHDRIAFYAGAAPRLFLMMLDNDSPFVRGEDNEIGIGGGFQAGFWIFPIPSWRDFYIDLFGDYSLKTMKIEPDEISSDDFDVNISGITAGIGIGVRF